MASKSTIPGVWLVRCPRCRKVLVEIASVPVYQCGECGATLRAKHYSSTNQNSNVTAPEITVSASSGARSAGYLDPQLSKAADASSSFSNKGDEHAEDCLKERQMELEDSFFNARGMDIYFQSFQRIHHSMNFCINSGFWGVELATSISTYSFSRFWVKFMRLPFADTSPPIHTSICFKDNITIFWWDF
ncbi:uncharacterized protein LOC141832148 [Curcuma longa]|uniref:uncharacterized protein LOC141832148 n=1 Tax=Curcuma longa TaxID=136217 RepID=UPI003D9DB8A5